MQTIEKGKMEWLLPDHREKEKWTGCIQTIEKQNMDWLHALQTIEKQKMDWVAFR